MSSIFNSNGGFILASYLEQHQAKVKASIYRLSSGNKLYNPASNPASFAIGTLLSSDIKTLDASLNNTYQANSLFGVAIDGLKNISDILQRQKSLVTHAVNTGLSAEQRFFLNQEFQELKAQINQIALSTNFNGIKLLDGTLSTVTNLNSKTSDNSIAASGILSFQQNLQPGDIISINGVQFTIKSTPPVDSRDVAIGYSAEDQAFKLMNAINSTLNSIDADRSADKLALSGLSFNNISSNIIITSKSAGEIFNQGGSKVINITGNISNINSIQVNGIEASKNTVALSSGAIIARNGDLAAGSFANNNTAYSGSATTIATGIIGDNILTNINVTDANNTGINLSAISDNTAFIGKINGFTANYTQNGFVDVSITVGGIQYMAKNVSTNPDVETTVRFAAVGNKGGYFDLRFNSAAHSDSTAVTNQAEANLFAHRINAAFDKVEVFQKRTIDNYMAAGTIYKHGTTTKIGSLSGTSFALYASDFKDLTIKDISIAAAQAGRDAVISVNINGEIYQSGFNAQGEAHALGNSIAAGESIGLRSLSNPNNLLVFNNNATTLIDLSSELHTNPTVEAFKNAFNIKHGNSGLQIQINTSSKDLFNSSIPSAKLNDIYIDNDGIINTDINLMNIGNASRAVEVIDNAINKVTAMLAYIGGAQSSLDYVAANIQSSITNIDAARSNLLDTDIAEEYIELAKQQLRIKATISVMAKFNDLQTSLLKLIV